MSRRRSSFALLALPLLFAACGGGNDMADDEAAGAGGEAEATSSTTSTTSAPGKGTGTLSIGGAEYAFTAEPCRIEGEGDEATVQAEGKGDFEGRAFTVTVKRSPSDASVIENFQLVFSAKEAIVGTNFVSLPGGADSSRIEVEGEDEASGTFAFLGTGGRPSGEGTFTLTCEG